MVEKLKQCPFCGADAEFIRFGDRRMSTVVACTECGCGLESGETHDHGRDWNTRYEDLVKAGIITPATNARLESLLDDFQLAITDESRSTDLSLIRLSILELMAKLKDQRNHYQSRAKTAEELADKYKWQVRDTCTRAETAEAERDRLEKMVSPDANAFMQALVDECSAEITKRKAADAELERMRREVEEARAKFETVEEHIMDAIDEYRESIPRTKYAVHGWTTVEGMKDAVRKGIADARQAQGGEE